MAAPRGVPYKEKCIFFARGQISRADQRENLHDRALSVPYVGLSTFGSDIFSGLQIAEQWQNVFGHF